MVATDGVWSDDIPVSRSSDSGPFDVSWAKVGTEITHSKFGVGRVVRVGLYKRLPAVTVDFGGFKRMLAIQEASPHVVEGAIPDAPRYERPVCAAGRTAFLGDRWAEPCDEDGQHALSVPSGRSVRLCSQHMAEVSREARRHRGEPLDRLVDPQQQVAVLGEPGPTGPLAFPPMPAAVAQGTAGAIR